MNLDELTAAMIGHIPREAIRLPCGHLMWRPEATVADHECVFPRCGHRYRVERSRKGGYSTRPVSGAK